MALNQWSKRSLVLFAAICAIGGFLAGSSSSQVREAPPVDEVGRYQLVITSGGNIVFDTKTARYWATTITHDNKPIYPQMYYPDIDGWKLIGSPFEKGAPKPAPGK